MTLSATNYLGSQSDDSSTIFLLIKKTILYNSMKSSILTVRPSTFLEVTTTDYLYYRGSSIVGTQNLHMLMLMKISKRGAHQNAAAIQHYIPSPTFYYDQPHISINLSIVSYKSIKKRGNDKFSNIFMAYKELSHSAKIWGII